MFLLAIIAARRSGKFDDALALIRPVLARIKRPVYGVLGNHDTIRMVPDLEAMGICMLLNECEPIMRGGCKIYLAGIDDAHYFRVDNIEKAASGIPHRGIFDPAIAHARNLSTGSPCRFRSNAEWPYPRRTNLSPGSIPLTLGSVLPRRFGAGAWEYHNMAGYTSTGVGSSIVPVRINCLPEITLHRLWRAEEGGSSIGAVAQSQPEKETREQ